MSKVFFAELGIPNPDVHLGITGTTHGEQIADVLTHFERVLDIEKPDVVIIPGDVNSSMAGALVASRANIPVVHLEAGLRSFDKTMPEEVNRIIIDHVSSLLLTPSIDADHNLKTEGIDPAKIARVGNIIIDTLCLFLKQAKSLGPLVQKNYKIATKEYVLATLHRDFNVMQTKQLTSLMGFLERIANKYPVVFPVHPRTKKCLVAIGYRPSAELQLISPVGYIEFLALQMHAKAVVTDSGGVQEETTYLNVPCLTVRPNTERPVTLLNGTNRLVNIYSDDPIEIIDKGKVGHAIDLWDGKTAVRVVNILLKIFG